VSSWNGFKPGVLLFINMEPHQSEVESFITPLKKVTPLSKYLALGLFILLPFLGGWIGYSYAPVVVVEVDKPVPLFVPTKTEEVPSLLELQRTFTAQRTDRYEISPLYTSTKNNTQYFKSYVPNSSACCGIYKFLPERNSFYNTGVRIDMAIGEKESPSGRYIANVTDRMFIKVYDLEIQSLATEPIVINGEETLVSATCGYAGYAHDLQWLDESTLQYGVYKTPDSYDSCPVMELIEHRLIELE
jgi:hypothetical protein